MQATRPEGVQTEVLAYGRPPLALSARFFTARSRNLPKDDSQYRCLNYPDGCLVATREDTPFVVLNGIQTLSATFYKLPKHLKVLRERKVHVLRVIPRPRQTEGVLDAGNALDLAAAANGFDSHPSGGVRDLVIEGTTDDFLLLIAGREDHYNLFFQRFLRMSGDTALGVHLKNFRSLRRSGFPAAGRPGAAGSDSGRRLYERVLG